MMKFGSAVCTDRGVLAAADDADEGVRLTLLTVGVCDRWPLPLPLLSLAALLQ